MQSTLTSIFNLQWANAEKTMIDCNITTSQFGDEVLPFTASKNDCEAHGRAIFTDAAAGVYGNIAEYVPPKPESIEVTATPSSGEIPVDVL